MLIDELLRQNDTLSLCYIYCILRLPVHFGSIKNNILLFSTLRVATDLRDGPILISYRQLHPRDDVSSGDTRAAYDKCIGLRRRQ